jgi:hypothetical protein
MLRWSIFHIHDYLMFNPPNTFKSCRLFNFLFAMKAPEERNIYSTIYFHVHKAPAERHIFKQYIFRSSGA